MPKKQETILFEFKEIVTAMIRERGLTEGIWQLYVEFKLVAANMPFGDSDDPTSPQGPEDGPAPLFLPTAIVPISKIGLLRVETETLLAVDAAKVNPKKRSTSARKTPKKRK